MVYVPNAASKLSVGSFDGKKSWFTDDITKSIKTRSYPSRDHPNHEPKTIAFCCFDNGCPNSPNFDNFVIFFVVIPIPVIPVYKITIILSYHHVSHTVFIYSTSKDNFDKSLPIAEHMIKSFKFGPQASS
jgi:hypothetical protein